MKAIRNLFLLFLVALAISHFAHQVVLLVPAIMGSTLKESTSVVPRLPPPPASIAEIPSVESLKIHDPYGIVGFSRLKELLGSDLQKLVFEVPYDWRQTLGTIWKTYLKPFIDKVKVLDEENKVDIIAHSMGGLVVRAYIQSDTYENDIRRFVMLGTPNEGYPGVYLMLEQNDIHENKKNFGIFEIKNLPLAMLQQIQVKESIIFEQLLKYTGFIEKDAELFASQTVVIREREGYTFRKEGQTVFYTHKEVSELLGRMFPSLYSLLPTYPFLKNESGTISYRATQPNELMELNGAARMEYWKNRVGFLPGQIRAFLFLSKSGSNNSVNAIYLPGLHVEKSSGDGTVLDYFVDTAGFGQVFEETITLIRDNFGRHDGLPGDDKIHKELLRLLNNPLQ